MSMFFVVEYSDLCYMSLVCRYLKFHHEIDPISRKSLHWKNLQHQPVVKWKQQHRHHQILLWPHQTTLFLHRLQTLLHSLLKPHKIKSQNKKEFELQKSVLFVHIPFNQNGNFVQCVRLSFPKMKCWIFMPMSTHQVSSFVVLSSVKNKHWKWRL